jgi:protein arginine kinase activator
MLCQECEERNAKVHVTKIISGEKKELYLCKDCAQEIGGLDFGSEFSFDTLLTGLLNDKLAPDQKFDLAGTETKCKACGLSYKEFSRNGKLGCQDCYKHFGNRLEKVLRRVHSSTSHKGKIPKQAGKKIKQRRRIEELNQKMDAAVEEENFEKAAVLRDEIKEIKANLNKGEE